MKITVRQLRSLIEAWTKETEEENPPTRTLGMGYGFSNPTDEEDQVESDVDSLVVTSEGRDPWDAEDYLCSDCGSGFDAQKSKSDFPECPYCGSPRVAPIRGHYDKENDLYGDVDEGIGLMGTNSPMSEDEEEKDDEGRRLDPERGHRTNPRDLGECGEGDSPAFTGSGTDPWSTSTPRMRGRGTKAGSRRPW